MTAATTAVEPAEGADRPERAAGARSWPTARSVLASVVVAQAAWLAWSFGRGWFLQADLSNLAEGIDRRPTWDYLTAQLGGHFTPVARFVYWVFNQTSPLDYGSAVALRVACQAVSTVLLYRLLTGLVSSERLVLVVITAYAFNPMLIGGTAQFTPGITIGIGQVFFLLALLAHARHEVTRRVWPAAAAGALLAVAVLASEQWAVAVAVFPLLSAVHYYGGTVRERVVELGRHWLTWLLLLAPLSAVGVGALVFTEPVGAAHPSMSASYRLLRDSWLYSLGPSWIGGPLEWLADGSLFISTAAPPDLVVVLGQFAVAITVLLGIQRNGPRSLAAWLLPVSFWLPSMLLVGYRGFEQLNVLIAVTPRYIAALIPVFAIGVVLALSPDGVAAASPSAARREAFEPAVAADRAPVTALDDHPSAVPANSRARHRLPSSADLATVAAGVLVVAIIATSIVSTARFADVFGRVPAHRYVENLAASARFYGDRANVYDTAVPGWLISPVEPHHRVTDLLALSGVAVKINDPSSTPLVATADGRLVPSVFVAAASVPGVAPCGTAVVGAGTSTHRLSKPVPGGEWYLQLRLFQQRPSTVSVDVVDAAGRVSVPVSGPRLQLGRLAAVTVRLPFSRPVAVRIHSSDPETSICMTTIQVGAPFPRPGS